MKFFKFTFLLIFISTPLVAEYEGKVISKECPFNCKIAGIKKKYCSEWEKDGKCFIRDNSPRIYIDKRVCPYNCKMLRLSKRECRDYKENTMCVVERKVGLKF